MEGDERDGASKDDLAYVLMLILGVRDPAREVECQADPEKHGLARFIVFDEEGSLQLRKGGQDKLAAKFRSFFINKLQMEADQKNKQPRIGKPSMAAVD